MKKKSNFYKKNFNKKKVMFGKGKEYSEVSREVENTFQSWLSFSGVDEDEFDRRMKAEPYRVEESINGDGDIEINIFAGDRQVIVPLIFQPNGGGNIDDFIVNALLVLSHIASRYEDKSFEKAVGIFADKMIAERKLTL